MLTVIHQLRSMLRIEQNILMSRYQSIKSNKLTKDLLWITFYSQNTVCEKASLRSIEEHENRTKISFN